MPIPEPPSWGGDPAPRLPCPHCARLLVFRQPLSLFLQQCPACGRNPVLYFAGCDHGSLLGEVLAHLLFEHRLFGADVLDDLLQIKKDASPHGLLSYALAAGYVKEAALIDLARRLVPGPWRAALDRLAGPSAGPTRLQKVLDRNELLSPEQMKRALALQREKGGPLGKILIDLGYLTEAELLRALAEDLGMPFVNLNDYEPSELVLAQLSPTVALVYEAIPVALKDGVLTVAVADPLNGSVLEDLEFLLARQLQGAVASPQALRAALEKHYGTLAGSAAPVARQVVDLPIVERHLGFLVLLLLRRPHHRLILTLEPGKNRMQYGPPGGLIPIPPPPDRIVPALAARLKSMVGLVDRPGEKIEDSGSTRLKVQGRAGRLMVLYHRDEPREEFEVLLEP